MATYGAPTTQQVEDASATELRQMLLSALAEIRKLDTDVREARMSAAHYKLQHNLLAIETEVAAKRMEVEHEMTRREVEVLQLAELARREVDSPGIMSNSGRYFADIKAYCEAMDNENALLHRRLQRCRKMIDARDDELSVVMEENQRLVTRIRENREHLNRLKSPGGIFSAATPRISNNGFPTTPQQYRSTPKHTSRSLHQEHEGSQDSFAALLLADRVLNQENSSAPSTPLTTRPPPASHLRHNRGVHSLSSLPSTPVRPFPMSERSDLLPSPNIQHPQSEPQNRSGYHYFTPQKERSRKSRDSTISAEDAQEIAAYNANESGDEEIPESQASQSATEMLRRDPRESMEVVRSPTPSSAAEKSTLLQTKIFGSVTKSGAEKRKRTDGGLEYHVKKSRIVSEGIGLGIDNWV